VMLAETRGPCAPVRRSGAAARSWLPAIDRARPALHSDGLADVAQLVEHFTRNEGVRGSNPRVGFAPASGLRDEGGLAGPRFRCWVRSGSD
jgi:hypothetical protein